ncbi:thiosulfate sulfurtransferase [Haladaptatus paucihalophilus DX253]|uniref:Thiosulfate sulfurtransferase n=1 Tax=Haladaptatus paucihalophilus DX253 TaxID=797209 RepID=E7QZ12_HALPU|nr:MULTISPECIES: sulfurtransferase [Haladaptatus]EFW90428.1 thiosulfate sulfurtransferase [Haladaptatus paucihalophilus DX253]GKZ13330.1 sulfurtransferase [Haladaptatus sp. T7]SHK04288.1 thiosulfate/3-mercaptopyruvate sulfurtransferase [Haladaptatus paucihalophilus DX253]
MTSDTTDALVSVGWVVDRLDEFQRDDPSFRLLEVDIDPSNYDEAHVPGATKVDWRTELQDSTTFDVPTKGDFEALLGGHGITEDSTVVLYGDMMNWFAAYAYWLLTYYGHSDVRLLNGGRDSWLGRDAPVTDEVPEFTARSYSAAEPNADVRADQPDVLDAIPRETSLIDVRTPEEYRGEILAPPGWNEGVQRGGHIPGAVNIPWSQVVDGEGRFKSEDELRAIYEAAGIDETTEIITYCRIGERSALTWFVLHELLDFEDVRNYYGSWVEWGNTVGAPIEKGQRAEIRRQ